MPVIQHQPLRKLAFEVFRAAGLSGEDAGIVSEHLVDSNLAGHDSHGVWCLPRYVPGMRENYVTWEEREVLRETPCLAVIDCKGGNGIVATTRALDIAVEKARGTTFGFVGLRNTTHIGRLGDYTPRIAGQGMFGLVWLNGGGLFMTPNGSADRRLCPEPISFGAPRRNGPPFMLDVTMTTVAGGKIEQKIVRGDPMPDNWVIDRTGSSVSDAMQYRNHPEETGVPPVGWPQFGHKGAGLAMMIEMLVGPLSHAGCTKGPDKGGGQGVMVLAIDIEAFTDLDTYKDEVEGLRDWVCSARPLPGVERVYAPGEIEEECRQKRLRDGIEIPEPTWEQIAAIAAELGVEVPAAG